MTDAPAPKDTGSGSAERQYGPLNQLWADECAVRAMRRRVRPKGLDLSPPPDAKMFIDYCPWPCKVIVIPDECPTPGYHDIAYESKLSIDVLPRSPTDLTSMDSIFKVEHIRLGYYILLGPETRVGSRRVDRQARTYRCGWGPITRTVVMMEPEWESWDAPPHGRRRSTMPSQKPRNSATTSRPNHTARLVQLLSEGWLLHRRTRTQWTLLNPRDMGAPKQDIPHRVVKGLVRSGRITKVIESPRVYGGVKRKALR